MSLILLSIIITEDKDFGELVFKHKQDFFSVILLRYSVGEEKRTANSLLSLLKNHLNELPNSFVTISPYRTRIRFI